MEKQLTKAEYDNIVKRFRKIKAERDRERRRTNAQQTPFTLSQYESKVMKEVEERESLSHQDYDDDVFEFISSMRLPL